MAAAIVPLSARASAFAGRRVLITGGMGFIGSALAGPLVNAGATVSVLDCAADGSGANPFNLDSIADRIRLIAADMRDRASVEAAVAGQDVVLNLAAQTGHQESMDDPYTDLDVNARAQIGLLEACRKLEPKPIVVYASTRQLYGRPRYLPVDEGHPVLPPDANAINKLAGEWYHRLYHAVHHVPTAILRLTNTYGPGMRVKDAKQCFLGIWVRRVLEDGCFEVWEGEQRRDLNYIDDVVDAFLLAATSEAARGRVFNLGAEPVSLAELGILLQELAGQGRSARKSFPPERKRIDIGDYYGDWSQMRDALGWRPATPLRDGLRKTLEFYRRNLSQYL